MHHRDLTQRNIERLAELFPTVVTEQMDDEGKPVQAVDFDLLRQELSDHVIEGPRERYQLDWPGKRNALFAANAPVTKTLRPVPDESVNFDTTQNLFIEGDNLDAMKLLQESFLGRVKMIYLDPPYNTGNDFVYLDDYSERAQDYLTRSGQTSSEGTGLVSNPSTSGRYHSNWLSMMYPRLRIARNLLTDDGMVFISIDDNELHNLVSIVTEIFGDKCYLGSIAWLKKRKGSFLSKGLVSMHEYIVAVGRKSGGILFGGTADSTESQPLVKRTNARSVLRVPGGRVETRLSDGTYPAGSYGEGSSSVELLHDARVADGTFVTELELEGPFIWSQRYLDEQLSLGARITVNTSSFQPRVFKVQSEDQHKGFSSFIEGVRLGATNEDAYEHGKELFGVEGVLDYPKPVNLIKTLVEAATHFDPNAIVMDFFAGSGTTAEAVLSLNAEDGGARRFLLVQLPEEVGEDSAAARAGFSTISDVACARLKKVGERTLGDASDGSPILDVGFRFLRVDSSYSEDVRHAPELTDQTELHLQSNSVKADRTDEDLLLEVMLEWGLDPGLPLASEDFGADRCLIVDDGALVGFFAETLHADVIRELAGRQPLRVVFRDSAFATDAARINAEQIFAEMSPTTDVKVI